jgi:hypothetical protein
MGSGPKNMHGRVLLRVECINEISFFAPVLSPMNDKKEYIFYILKKQ